MKMLAFLAACVCFAASAMASAPEPIPVTIDSRFQEAPRVEAFRANVRTYRVSFKDGGAASDLTNTVPFMHWGTNATAASVSTSTWAFVGATSNGVVDFTFAAGALNFAPGRYVYEAGVLVGGSPQTYRQGVFQISPSLIGSGASAIMWTTNVNWSLIAWQNLPTSWTDTFARAVGTAASNLAASVQSDLAGKLDVSHATESSNTVHGGFMVTIWTKATNAWEIASAAFTYGTNALAIAQTAFGWGDHADAGYATAGITNTLATTNYVHGQGFVTGAVTGGLITASTATNITGGVLSTGTAANATQAEFLSLDNGLQTLIVSNGLLYVTVITNNFRVIVTGTSGEGYNGPAVGTVFSNMSAVIENTYYTSDFTALLSARAGYASWPGSVFGAGSFSIEDGDIEPSTIAWQGDYVGALPQTLTPRFAAMGTLTIDWVTVTNTYCIGAAAAGATNLQGTLDLGSTATNNMTVGRITAGTGTLTRAIATKAVLGGSEADSYASQCSLACDGEVWAMDSGNDNRFLFGKDTSQYGGLTWSRATTNLNIGTMGNMDSFRMDRYGQITCDTNVTFQGLLIKMPNLPVSSNGLTAGTLWRDGELLKVVVP